MNPLSVVFRGQSLGRDHHLPSKRQIMSRLAFEVLAWTSDLDGAVVAGQVELAG